MPPAQDDAQQHEQQQSRARVRQAHKEFRAAGPSDALAAMTALLTFEAAGRSAEWCVSHGLHFRHLQEASALRRQLGRVLAHGLGCRPEELLAGPERAELDPKPPVRVADALRRGSAAGWADQVPLFPPLCRAPIPILHYPCGLLSCVGPQLRAGAAQVARRVKPREQVAQDTDGGRRNRAVRYTCVLTEHEVFLHPNSAMHASSPDYVVYKEVVRNAKRPYMAVVTEVRPACRPTGLQPPPCLLFLPRKLACASPPPSKTGCCRWRHPGCQRHPPHSALFQTPWRSRRPPTSPATTP